MAPGTTAKSVTAHGCLEQRSKIQNFPVPAHAAGSFAGVRDCLRHGRVEEATARAALGVASLDQLGQLGLQANLHWRMHCGSSSFGALGKPAHQAGGRALVGAHPCQTARHPPLPGQEAEVDVEWPEERRLNWQCREGEKDKQKDTKKKKKGERREEEKGARRRKPLPKLEFHNA